MKHSVFKIIYIPVCCHPCYHLPHTYSDLNIFAALFSLDNFKFEDAGSLFVVKTC